MKLLIAFLIAASPYAFAAQETKEFNSKGLNDIEIESTGGDVVITATEGDKTIVVVNKVKFDEKKCRLKVDKQGDTLIIDLNKQNTLSMDECEVNFEIKSPKVADVEVTIGFGNLSITGVQGDLEYTIGRGNVLVDAKTEKVNGKTGAGDVAIKGLTGGGDLKIGTGKVDLTFATSELKGALDLKTGKGDAQLLFPKGTKLKTSYKAGSGDLTNELGDNPKPDFRVTMKAGSGDLNIKAY